MSKRIKRIGLISSGGDSPGMNPTIRSVVRTASHYGKEVVGFYNGYRGIIQNEAIELTANTVSGLNSQGGTMLKSARCKEFQSKKGRKQAYENLQKNRVDSLIVIGGDGSLSGAHEFAGEFDLPIIGIPGTIDNDMTGTEYTIGFDTAINTVIEAVDKLRDTALSHTRLFFVEVMGRQAGKLTLRSALAVGAAMVMIPEETDSYEKLRSFIQSQYSKRPDGGIILVAEGDETGGAIEVAKRATKEFPEIEARAVVLGHIQRGGTPSARDRIAGNRLGFASVEALLDDQRNVMVGFNHGKVIHFPLGKIIKNNSNFDEELLQLNEIMTRR